MSEVQERSTVQEIAQDLVAMCKAGQFNESGEKYWADDVLSVVGPSTLGAPASLRS